MTKKKTKVKKGMSSFDISKVSRDMDYDVLVSNIQEGSIINVIYGKNLRILYIKLGGEIWGGIRYDKSNNFKEVLHYTLNSAIINHKSHDAGGDFYFKFFTGRDIEIIGVIDSINFDIVV